MSSDRRNPVLLLDVMGTLVYDPFYVEVPAFLGTTLEELLAAKHPTAWARFETGEIDEARMLREFFRDARPVPPGLREHMARSYRWIEGMRELLEALAAGGYELHAHSNYPDWYRSIEHELELSRYLQWTFVSCLTGLRKPDPRAYEHAAEELRVAPADCVFVDDREENCRAARDVGMRALRFESAERLRADLRSLGIDVS